MAPDFEILWNIETMHMIPFFPAWSHVKRPLNSRIEDRCAGGMGDDPYPEIEDVHSSRTEDCEPMHMASLHFGR